MIPKEILKKVRQIELRTRHLVNTVFSGEYHSVFKGRGVEFAEVREYLPGDDVRTIDWNVTARMGHPFVKVFDEERELTVVLLVDASASGDFGTVARMKGEIGVEMCALLAFSAIQNNDRVGLIIFTDEVERFIPPKKGKKHVLRVIRELYYFQPKGRGTDIAAALDYLNRVTTRRSVVFLVSDFFASGYEAALKVANRRHDLVAVTISDPREVELPDVGIVEVEDAETGEEVLIDTSDVRARRRFMNASEEARSARQRLFRSVGVDRVDVRTDRPYIEPLMRFFEARAKRFR
ncbi:MAG: hypothetical protein A3F84_14765 [Candidatus Handelsmanbacteria bacterium RIFCSPLOWO2_12_FULL_64_10]|uniref:VWFA domain-containing protein n=1 Tax=Handelsmanbacteria sp. (strain RIFCSPLOWO2_12_FULL_64_10) TaxID=1817868 RepID=A0A1F6CYR6_HANXR|nr:MAG: hypothetical protein A3F84_14765 [Candidatus Handelsmanbacteria bacterium RIFCSPLOWO2_12_FULL_64_10]